MHIRLKVSVPPNAWIVVSWRLSSFIMWCTSIRIAKWQKDTSTRDPDTDYSFISYCFTSAVGRYWHRKYKVWKYEVGFTEHSSLFDLIWPVGSLNLADGWYCSTRTGWRQVSELGRRLNCLPAIQSPPMASYQQQLALRWRTFISSLYICSFQLHFASLTL
jgi:hypothetical protein